MFRALFILIASGVCVSLLHADDGSMLFATKCAKCHGNEGQGVAQEYDQPLVGDRSPAQLAKYIAKYMPPDDPGSIELPEATTIAEFVHAKFYSKDARERNKQPRVELSRLTVAQYRQTLADLVGSFRATVKLPETKGISAKYFSSRNFNADKMTDERTDAIIDFDFGTAVPSGTKLQGPEFAIRWAGSVYAPTTGDYEFIVRADHGFRLWVNHSTIPLIDKWVRSGADNEFRESIYLVGGRSYTLRLEFSKSKQGVNDSAKNPPKKDVPAKTQLLWKPPSQTAEIIPQRLLSPVVSAEQFISSVPFPPDDRSLGWERGTTISREWDQAVTEGTLQIASYILSNINDLAKLKPDDPNRADKIKAFALTFAERAFRKPLVDAEKRIFVERHFDAHKTNPEEALKRALLLVLKSPRFLYREAGTMPESYAVASRLSYMLLDTMPNEVLLRAASGGKLTEPGQIRLMAEALLKDPRAEAKLMGFFQHWFGLEHHGELSKNTMLFPGFDPELVTDLKTSLDLQLQELLRSPTADYRKLFTSNEFFVNDRMAKFYGITDVAGAKTFVPMKLDAGKRAGVIMHPYMMATFAYNAESSPIHRGVFLTRGILGQNLRPPNEAFTPFAADLHPKLTTRERTELQTKPVNCQACHSIINPLGFSLENFDAVGRFRESERGKQVDATGSYLTRTGETVTFNGPMELSKFLVNSPEVLDSFTQRLFHHLVQQPVRAYGANTQAELSLVFRKAEYNIRNLAVECIVRAAMNPQSSASNIITKPKGS